MPNPIPVLIYDPRAEFGPRDLDERFRAHAFQSLADADSGLNHLHPSLVIARLDEEAIQLCQRISERDPTLAVIFFGANLTTRLVLEGVRSGARDVVEQDRTWKTTLNGRIDAALAWRRALDKDTEAQVQSFIIQTELYQQQARSLGLKVDEIGLQLRAEKALLTQSLQQLELQKALAMAAIRAKASFLANMSHELHTPMNAIIGYAEMLRDELDAEKRQDAENILQSGKRLLSILQEVLNLARLESGEVHPVFERVSVAGLLQECVQQSRDQGRIQTVIGSEVKDVFTDPKCLQDAIGKLLDNALKFGGNGPVELRAFHCPQEGGICFEVADQGAGFDPKRWDQMVSAFTDDEQHAGGLGMGLAVATQLVRVLGGRLTGTNTHGGAAFKIWVPDTDERTVEDGNKRALSVLVVDDDPVLRKVLQHMLVADGHSVVTTGRADEALELARRTKPSLLLLDILLPGTDGITLLAEFKADPAVAHVPVVMLSATDDSHSAEKLGAVGFVQKPLSREVLRQLITDHALPPSANVCVIDGAPSSRSVRQALRACGILVEKRAAKGLGRVGTEPPASVVLPYDLPFADAHLVLSALSAYRNLKVVVVGRDLDPHERAYYEGQYTGVVDLAFEPAESVRALLQGP